jgi:MPBQ/MSBQ methyltransferase
MANTSRYVPNLVQFGDFDLELFFATEVLKLRSLHYGYFDANAARPITLDALRAAQARYTERLLSYLPPGTQTILDVGAGIGDNARALAERGYRVTSISPDKNHQRYFEAMNHPNITFHRSKYEDLNLDQRFDLVFFSESLNYFSREAGLRQNQRYVRPGGAILLAAMFRNGDWREYSADFQLKDLPFVGQARDFGFELEAEEDITEATAPTMEMVHQWFTEYLYPFMHMGTLYLQSSAPWKSWLLRFLFRKQLGELQRILAYYEKRTHPDTFRNSYRYAILRLRDTRPVTS